MQRILLTLILAFTFVSAFAETKFTRTEDVIYGRKFGTALTLDVFQPETPNGYGILFMVSGGFFSSHEAVNGNACKALLDRGYTVFEVVHGSQPKFTISEIELDIHRAVRFVRHNAAKYKIAPEKIGITGGSAGGHLSLTMGTQGAKGNPQAPDVIDRESSEVQAVACFYPPTDFLNWSKEGDDGVGFGPTIKHQGAFGPDCFSAAGRQKLGKEISPICFVTSKMAPTLVIHGDADQVVPLYQAKMFEKRCAEAKAPYKLIIKPGADHGWPGMDVEMKTFADWFDEHLRGIKTAAK
ncbi:MAG: Alpha/beta hydrolase protein [Verrucomicrobiales bacterium]|nr:Alpha/beta hydrolase protein [Verrucomicrobiales bacterium]